MPPDSIPTVIGPLGGNGKCLDTDVIFVDLVNRARAVLRSAACDFGSLNNLASKAFVLQPGGAASRA